MGLGQYGKSTLVGDESRCRHEHGAKGLPEPTAPLRLRGKAGTQLHLGQAVDTSRMPERV